MEPSPVRGAAAAGYVITVHVMSPVAGGLHDLSGLHTSAAVVGVVCGARSVYFVVVA